MSIKRFYTTTFTVTRQTWTGDSSALVSQGTFKGHIQQAGADIMQQYEGLRLTKAWIIWCAADTDVEEGDRITQGSDTYDVRFIENRNVGSNGHLHLICEKHDV